MTFQTPKFKEPEDNEVVAVSSGMGEPTKEDKEKSRAFMESLLLDAAKKIKFDGQKIKDVFSNPEYADKTGKDVLSDLSSSSNSIYADTTNPATQEFYTHVDNIEYTENLDLEKNVFEVSVHDASSNPVFAPMERTIKLELADRTVKTLKVSDFEWRYSGKSGESGATTNLELYYQGKLIDGVYPDGPLNTSSKNPSAYLTNVSGAIKKIYSEAAKADKEGIDDGISYRFDGEQGTAGSDFYIDVKAVKK